jgi:DNA-binding beta-propeller fold protein YncE
MTLQVSQTSRKAAPKSPSGRIIFLDISGGQIVMADPDGKTPPMAIVTGCKRIPDGIAIDTEARNMYWTNMGKFTENDGSIERADLDGKNRKIIVSEGGTFTPKQIQIDKKNGKLYWCDREGMRVMRANLDGSQIETLVETGRGETDRKDQRRWCVGIALDTDRNKMYWTQKGSDNAGQGRIFRANMELPDGERPDQRTDIELLFDELPEPIDLDLDPENRVMYWTDRGDPPRGNTVNRASMDFDPRKRPQPEILVTHLMEGIGLALDLKGGRMFFTDLGGSVYSANLDGTNHRTILGVQGNLTGIAYVES